MKKSGFTLIEILACQPTCPPRPWRRQTRSGFTLIEILVVIAIIGILVSILVPVAGKALESAKRRRAETEMNSIKMAILQFQSDHHYMPWPPEATGGARVGVDMWTTDSDSQLDVMNILMGSNKMKKIYLQIPEKSRPTDKTLLFLDPWSDKETDYTYYMIGMDRDLDGAFKVVGTGEPLWDGKTVMEKVLVYPLGDPETNPKKKLKTFDVPN